MMDRKRQAVTTITNISNSATSSSDNETCNAYCNDDAVEKNVNVSVMIDIPNKRLRTGADASNAAAAMKPPPQKMNGTPTIANTSFNNEQNSYDNDELQRVKMELSASNAENFALKQQNNELIEKMKNLEKYVEREGLRQEVGAEIELIIERYKDVLMQQNQEQQNDGFIMNQSNRQQQQELPSLSTSRKSSLRSSGNGHDKNTSNSNNSDKKLKTLVIELKEQIQECKDEMKRLEDTFEKKVCSVDEQHANESTHFNPNVPVIVEPEHKAVRTDARQRCAYCALLGNVKRTRFKCGNQCCNIPLCSVGNGRNSQDCFSMAHESELMRLAVVEKYTAMKKYTNRRCNDK